MLKYPLLIGLLYLSGCGKQTTDTPESPRIKSKKTTTVLFPRINQEVVLGEEVQFEIQSGEIKIDSVRIQTPSYSKTFLRGSFGWIPQTQRTGTYKFQISVYFNREEEIHYPRLKLLSDIETERCTYVVLRAYPHNTNDYTQGLFFLDDQLIESTGQEKKSEIKKIDIQSGEVISKTPLDDQFFGEGCTLYKNEIYQLTWNSRVGFVYDLALNKKRTFRYTTEGWGLTTIGDTLVMSDGSNKLYFMTPDDFSEIDRIEVYNNKESVYNLNELEYIDGFIYANEYQTNFIHVIEPTTGRVVRTIDLSGLLTEEEAQAADVLNGIAHDPLGDRLFVTGKWWPWIFEIKLQPKNTNL